MKLRQRDDREVFGISFLDVISCGFGAVLSLVIMARHGDLKIELPDIVNRTQQMEVKPKDLDIEAEIEKLSKESAALRKRKIELESRLKDVTKDVKNSSEMLSSMSVDTSPSIGRAGSMESVYSGGVPVGREYIIFIIDTSGSMQAHWSTMLSKVKAIVSAHPTVKGLQIMSDNGSYLIEGYAGRWIPDSTAARKRAMKKLETWSEYSNSSPAEGLKVALQKYAGKGDSVSIYVIGDDFTGASYQHVIDTIDRWNIDKRTGERSAIIHGIGFPWGLGDRFATLMREVAIQNGGVFVAL